MFELDPLASTPCTPAIKCLVPRTRELPDNHHDNHRCSAIDCWEDENSAQR